MIKIGVCMHSFLSIFDWACDVDSYLKVSLQVMDYSLEL